MRGLQQSPHAREGHQRRTDLKRRLVPGRTTPRRRRSVGTKPRRMPTPKPVIPSCPRCPPEARMSLANHAGRTESDPGPCFPLSPVLALDVLRARRAERTTSARERYRTHSARCQPPVPSKDERYAFPTLEGNLHAPEPRAHETQSTRPAVVMDRRGSCLAWYISSSSEHPLMIDTLVASKLWFSVVP